MKNILFIFNSKKDANLCYSKSIIEYLKEKNVNIYVENINLANASQVELINETTLKTINLVIVLGGDGTILEFARAYGHHEIPLLGINLGRVGALANAKMSNYKELFERYLNDDYFITKNLTLQGKINYANSKNDISFIVYNDVMVHRGLSIKLLPIVIGINNTRFDKVYADGVVIATPSGSSAYNFSAGGPLLSHNSNCYVITPICPQTRGFSSLVVNENEVVHLSIKSNTEEVYLSVDGCNKYPINNNDEVTISKSNYYLNLVNFDKQNSIYETVYKVMGSSDRKEEENV
jgi:NAD+ kinase